ncbi:hypothetical protein BaRGS_00023754 [Batillaria attramentaria]|uniref:Uncharacterized protein n=1 Tax=Batillaria attramentaria TaxID=370345 RepID=A0ABD0KCT6_9CAEN
MCVSASTISLDACTIHLKGADHIWESAEGYFKEPVLKIAVNIGRNSQRPPKIATGWSDTGCVYCTRQRALSLEHRPNCRFLPFNKPQTHRRTRLNFGIISVAKPQSTASSSLKARSDDNAHLADVANQGTGGEEQLMEEPVLETPEVKSMDHVEMTLVSFFFLPGCVNERENG